MSIRIDGSKLTPNGVLLPLISIYDLIDTDIGLYNLIKESFLNYAVFRKDFFVCPLNKVISELYFREEDNPLSVMVNKNVTKSDMNEYYSQFMDQYKKEILNYSINTNFVDAIKLFIESREITPTILYYDKYEEEYLANHEQLKNIKRVSIAELEMAASKMKDNQALVFTEIYVKKLSEITKKLYDCRFRYVSVYISTFGPNFEKKNNELSLKENEYLQYFIGDALQNTVSIIDLYKREIIK